MYSFARGSPFGRAGALAPERARSLPAARMFPKETSAAAAVSLYDPSCENAFGALRRARQTRNINSDSAIYAQSEAERILNRDLESRQYL